MSAVEKDRAPRRDGFPHKGYPYRRLTIPGNMVDLVREALINKAARIGVSDPAAADRLRRLARQLV